MLGEGWGENRLLCWFTEFKVSIFFLIPYIDAVATCAEPNCKSSTYLLFNKPGHWRDIWFRRRTVCMGGSRIFYRRRGALISCSTSTPTNHIVFFFSQNTSCIRKPQVISRGGGGVRTPCTLSLDPPLHCLGQRGRKLNPVQRHILV